MQTAFAHSTHHPPPAGAPAGLSPLTMTADELAGHLHISAVTLRRRRRALEASGMPAPIAGLVLTWSRPAIERWLGARPSEPVISIGGDDPIAAARDYLESRIGGGL